MIPVAVFAIIATEVPLDARAIFKKMAPVTVDIRSNTINGSGVRLWRHDIVVTSAHVLNYNMSDDKGWRDVYFVDGQPAIVLAVDSLRDLAVLQIDQGRTIGPVAKLRMGPTEVGESAFVVGSPRGLAGTITNGIVSTTRIIEGVRNIQISSPVNSGNSGGPVVDKSGLVIGIVRAKIDDAEGLAFAVASSELRSLYNSYVLPRLKMEKAIPIRLTSKILGRDAIVKEEAYLSSKPIAFMSSEAMTFDERIAVGDHICVTSYQVGDSAIVRRKNGKLGYIYKGSIELLPWMQYRATPRSPITRVPIPK